MGLLLCGLMGYGMGARAADPMGVRTLLGLRTGDIQKLRVPPSDLDLPQPRLPGGEIDPLYQITEAKRYLGKLLFHDPIRSNNIKPEFGGDLSTIQTASCGSCHFGHSGSKSGQVNSFAVGGEGRMTMSFSGSMTQGRQAIPGMVDLIPTGLVKTDELGNIVLDGRFDQVDSVPRLSPSVVGFAYNNRLLLGGVAGEPHDPANPLKANANPDQLPAGENLCQLAFQAHRMAGTQKDVLQANIVYQQLFNAAFPDEYNAFLTSGNMDDLINEDTIIRAVASFQRTAITRNTPWDLFLAGDDTALTDSQLRGAELFTTPADLGGADCISCHSGPALNKQLGDEDGLLVEENFYNLGLLEHPLQDLARTALENPDHHDLGRQDATADPADAYRFKTPTLRQVGDSGPMMHSGELATVRDVLEYFNAGVPSNPLAAAAGNLAPRFTNPRGPGLTGLGLSATDLDALEDFITNALYDPAFIFHDPTSTTRTFDPNLDDLTYSLALKALGAVDGFLPSRLAVGNNDDLTRYQTIFVRGWVNRDQRVDIGDAVFLLHFLFLGGPEPERMMAANVNGDGRVDIGDTIFLINFMFSGGASPPYPYPEAGQLVF